MSHSRILVLLACCMGAVGVGIGAMGAHGLPKYLAEQGIDPSLIPKKLADCETAVRYHMIHALAILSIGLSGWTDRNRLLRTAAWVLFLGVTLFSGGIYSIVFLQILGHWAIVPAGGTLMILGWILAGVGAISQKSNPNL